MKISHESDSILLNFHNYSPCGHGSSPVNSSHNKIPQEYTSDTFEITCISYYFGGHPCNWSHSVWTCLWFNQFHLTQAKFVPFLLLADWRIVLGVCGGVSFLCFLQELGIHNIYLAELVTILVALTSIASDTDITLWSDCLSAVSCFGHHPTHLCTIQLHQNSSISKATPVAQVLKPLSTAKLTCLQNKHYVIVITESLSSWLLAPTYGTIGRIPIF